MPGSKIYNPLKGAACGLVAGAGASFAMDVYWGLARDVMGARPEQKPKKGGKGQSKDEPSTQIIADKVSETLTGHEVPKEDKAAAGVVVHYATGEGLGALFGIVAALRPRWGLMAGLMYGTAIWLFLDEAGLRALNAGPDVEDVPVSQHLQALGAHLVYGASTALLSRVLLKAL